MSKHEFTFSINGYDRDGDRIDDGIFLHFGDTRIKVADGLVEFSRFCDQVCGILEEITENGLDCYLQNKGTSKDE